MKLQQFNIGYMPMKPNNYIQNSDYLSFAEVDKNTATITFSARSVPANGTQDYYQTINVKSVAGAIDRCFVKINGSTLIATQNFYHYPTNNTSLWQRFLINRSASNVIKITEVIRNGGTSTWNAPAATLNITILTFKPPNTS